MKPERRIQEVCVMKTKTQVRAGIGGIIVVEG